MRHKKAVQTQERSRQAAPAAGVDRSWRAAAARHRGRHPGPRVEVWDDTAKAWFSLHARRIRPRSSSRQRSSRTAPRKGSFRAPRPPRRPGSDDSPVHVHESVFGWEGWSLSAARPGKARPSRERRGNRRGADVDPDPVTPLVVDRPRRARHPSAPALSADRTPSVPGRSISPATAGPHGSVRLPPPPAPRRASPSPTARAPAIVAGATGVVPEGTLRAEIDGRGDGTARRPGDATSRGSSPQRSSQAVSDPELERGCSSSEGAVALRHGSFRRQRPTVTADRATVVGARLPEAVAVRARLRRRRGALDAERRCTRSRWSTAGVEATLDQAGRHRQPAAPVPALGSDATAGRGVATSVHLRRVAASAGHPLRRQPRPRDARDHGHASGRSTRAPTSSSATAPPASGTWRRRRRARARPSCTGPSTRRSAPPTRPITARLLAVAVREAGTLFDVDVPTPRRSERPRPPARDRSSSHDPGTPTSTLKSLPLPAGEAPAPGQYVIHDTDELTAALPARCPGPAASRSSSRKPDATVRSHFPSGLRDSPRATEATGPNCSRSASSSKGTGARRQHRRAPSLSLGLPPGDVQRFRLASSSRPGRPRPLRTVAHPPARDPRQPATSWKRQPTGGCGSFTPVRRRHAGPCRTASARGAAADQPARRPTGMGSTECGSLGAIDVHGPSTESAHRRGSVGGSRRRSLPARSRRSSRRRASASPRRFARRRTSRCWRSCRPG